MSEQSMTLLSQSEIDTLISFLTSGNQDNKVESEVLSQDSIDKLISLIKTNGNDKPRFAFDLSSFDFNASKRAALFSKEDDTYADDIEYNLIFEVQDGMAKVFGKNSKTGKLVAIRPGDITRTEDSNDEEWGSCIVPSLFVAIAASLGVTYTNEVLEEVCKNFAKVMFGNENAKLPAIYLP